MVETESFHVEDENRVRKDAACFLRQHFVMQMLSLWLKFSGVSRKANTDHFSHMLKCEMRLFSDSFWLLLYYFSLFSSVMLILRSAVIAVTFI